MEIIARTRTFSREINPNSSASRSRRDKFCSKMLGVLASYLHRITNKIRLRNQAKIHVALSIDDKEALGNIGKI